MNNSETRGVAEVSDDSFDGEVLQSPLPVLADFWAPWCGPCKAVAPLLEELAAENPNLRVVKVNVDDNPKTAERYNVRAIPTLILFRNGEVADTKMGASPKKDLEEFVRAALA